MEAAFDEATSQAEQMAQQAQQQQNDPGHQGGNLQAGHAMRAGEQR